MKIKQYIPRSLRVKLSVSRRNCKDFFSGDSALFSKTGNTELVFPYSIQLTQPIRPGSYLENKIHNIKNGINRIEQIIVYPGEIFSFWQIIKNPLLKRGYKTGRNIIAGELKEDIGGGLCQLSSAIFHISLIGGLRILERHNHTVDIYKEHERFTPLGADATVVFGYKDLRIKNENDFPVRFAFEIAENKLSCSLQSTKKIKPREIVFDRVNKEANTEVTATIISADKKIIVSTSVYH